VCGITGILAPDPGQVVDADLLQRMTAAIAHRGPDAQGIHSEPGIGLGHRRLSIIDVAGGAQPLWNEDRSVVVVFNGEIYNFPELATELQAAGHQFATHSDTEVIVHAWEQWGEACVQRFRGMFAFALWDRNRRCLFLTRDRLGIKPLYYAWLDDGTLIFGSELKALMVHPGLRREIEPRAVEEYFAFGYIPDPRTILRQARKLPPGHSLRVDPDQPHPHPRPYWDLEFAADGPSDPAAAADELSDRLREAVRVRMIAEVPLGAFLSGGVDSSGVVAMMAGLSDKPVDTCSITFSDPRFDEGEYARQVADRYHTRHHPHQVEPDDFDLLERLAGVYDEPYADSSALPTYRLCQQTRRHVTVALSGDGGDETLAGYRRYRFHLAEERLRNLVPLGLRRPVFGMLGRVYPKLDWAPRVLRAKSTLEGMSRDSVDGFFHSISVLGDPLRQRLFSPAFRRELQGYRASEVMREHARRAPTDDPLAMVQYLDLKTWLPGDILTKVDRASMAHGLEVRVPILDHQLVEWMCRLPPDLKLRGGEGKFLLKKALEPLLPNEILYRPKMGFSMPIAAWFRGPLQGLLRDRLLGNGEQHRGLGDSGLFDMDFVTRLLGQHQSGRRDHATPLWALLMYASFEQQVLDA
jgi:asparagine synthase (glutamine-hydrolysing)